MYFAAVDEARFRRPVVPGRPVAHGSDRAQLARRTFCKLQGVATVNGEVAAEATLMCMLVDRDPVAAPSDDCPPDADGWCAAMSEIDPRAIVSPSARIGTRRPRRRICRRRRRRGAGRRLRARAARRGPRSGAHRPQECFRFVLFGWRRSSGSEIQRRAHRTGGRRRQPFPRIFAR